MNVGMKISKKLAKKKILKTGRKLDISESVQMKSVR